MTAVINRFIWRLTGLSWKRGALTIEIAKGTKYKYTFLFIMGNNYRNMVDITLTCRLFKDVEKNSKKFTVEINTQDLILDLLEEIYKKVELNNDFPSFGEIEATVFKLWKVEINNDDNDKFSSLVLPNDDAKSLNKLRERINDYWDDEEKRPKKGCTHIIINSPRLIERRQNQDKDGEIVELREQVERLRRLQIQGN